MTFECSSDTTLEATLYLYDLSARLLWQKPFSLTGGAVNRLSWNGYSDWNEFASNGVYLYRLVEKSAKTSLARGKVWVINR